MHNFHCNYRCSCGASVEWDASWEMAGAANDTEGFRVHEGSRQYDVIIGCAEYASTKFLIVPSLGVGIEVESYTDRSHVEYRLSEICRLDRRNAVTISSALADYFGP